MIDNKSFQAFHKGAMYMLLSSFITAVFASFVKLGVLNVFMPLLVFLRFIVPALLMIPYFYYHFEEVKSISYRNTAKHFYRAIAALVCQYSLFYYLTKGSLTDGVLLWNTAPMFIPIISYAIFKHKVSKTVWLSLLVSFLGVVCILKPTSGVFDFFSIYGFIAGISVAFSQVLYGINREKSTMSQNLFLFFLYLNILSLIILIGSMFFYDLKDVCLKSFTQANWLKSTLAVIGASGASIGVQFARGYAYSYAKPASLAPLIYFSVIFAALIDIMFGRFDDHGFIFTIGILLVFVGTFIRFSYTVKD